MSINLIETLQGHLGSDVVRQLGGVFGQGEGAAQKGINAILPSLMGGLMLKASSPGGASALFDLVSKGGHDGGMLNNIGGMIGTDADKMQTQGNGILDVVLGNRLGNVVDLVSSSTGVGKMASRGMFSMLAPMLMGVIGKQVKSGGLDAGGLANMLLGQKDYVTKSAPTGLANVLGISGFNSLPTSFNEVGDKIVGSGKKVVSGVTDAGRNVASGAANAGRSVAGGAADLGGKGLVAAGGVAAAGGAAASGGLGWLKALIPLLLLGLVGIFAWQMCGTDVKNAAGSVTDKAGSAVSKVTEKAGDAVTKVTDVAGDAAGKVSNTAGAVAGAAGDAAGDAVKSVTGFFGLDKLGDFLKDPKSKAGQSFLLDKVTFATGSANLTSTSNAQLNDIAEILKSNATVHIQLEGHTDNTGNAAKNTTLSDARAKSVMAYLVKKGIAANRMKAKGFGSVNPTATNDTKEGRQKNRRTEMRITKK